MLQTANSSAASGSSVACPEPTEHAANTDAIGKLGNDILVLLHRADQLDLPFVAIRLDEAAALCLADRTATDR